MLTTGYISFDRLDDGVPFQSFHGALNYWHPGENPNKRIQIDGLLASEMRMRVELGHGTWVEIAEMYGFSTWLSDKVYPYCMPDERHRLICERLSVQLVDAIIGSDHERIEGILNVISCDIWYIDWLKMEASNGA